MGERVCLTGHILSLVFGLVGILLVVPHPEFIINNFQEVGQNAMQLSMTGGGAVYIILGASAVFLHLKRNWGISPALAFLLPSVLISLSAELLGTSTGFPFGHYSYLSGLGYKIGGLVPFTIPLSWFYLGCASYLLARAGLQVDKNPSWLRHLGAIAFGALLLTSWDFVLDPAMSQTSLPFWYWQQPGAFFGMPYQNFAGWFVTGALFMSVTALLWKRQPLSIEQSQLHLPLVIYLSNFTFATVMSLAAGFPIPVLLGLFLGVTPAVVLWWKAQTVTLEITNVNGVTTEKVVATPMKAALK